MLVAQVVTRFIAGAGGVALRGSLALQRAGYSIAILTADGGDLLGEAEGAGLQVVRLRHMRPEINPREDFLALNELRQALFRLRPAVVHTHSAKAGAIGRLAAHQLASAAIVHTFHGFPFHSFQRPWTRRGYIAAERRLGRITDRFLAVGSAVAAEAVRLRIAPPERVRTIASAIDPAIGRSTTQDRLVARARLSAVGVPDGVKLVGTVGRLDNQKAPRHMLEAITHLHPRDVHFAWVGGGPLQQEMEKRIIGAGLRGRFHLLGQRNDVGQLLPAFDVFAMASLYEGLPCAMVEAVMCGVPVVATSVNAVPEVVHPGRTGLLVPAARPELLGRAIAFLLDHPDEGRRMAAEARRLIGDRFQPDLLGADLDETYTRALTERALRPTRAVTEGLTA